MKSTWSPDEARRFIMTSARVWERLWFAEGGILPARVMWIEGDTTWVRWARGHGTRVQGVLGQPGDWLWARVSRLDTANKRLVLEPWGPPAAWRVVMTADYRIRLRAPTGEEVPIVTTNETWTFRVGEWVDIRIERVRYPRGSPAIYVTRRGATTRIVARQGA